MMLLKTSSDCDVIIDYLGINDNMLLLVHDCDCDQDILGGLTTFLNRLKKRLVNGAIFSYQIQSQQKDPYYCSKTLINRLDVYRQDMIQNPLPIVDNGVINWIKKQDNFFRASHPYIEFFGYGDRAGDIVKPFPKDFCFSQMSVFQTLYDLDCYILFFGNKLSDLAEVKLAFSNHGEIIVNGFSKDNMWHRYADYLVDDDLIYRCASSLENVKCLVLENFSVSLISYRKLIDNAIQNYCL